MLRISNIIAFLFLAGFGQFLAAQSSKPEEIAETYFNTLRTQGFSSTGNLIHPEALEKFKEMLIPVYEYGENVGDPELKEYTFGETATVEGLKEMSPIDFFNGFMNLISLQLGTETLSFDNLEIVGTVAEGEDMHVLTRMTVSNGGISIREFEVISLKPYQGDWRVQLNGEWEGMAEALRASIPSQ